MKKITTIACTLALILLFGVTGEIDRKDAELQQALYCDNVRSGVWPDFEDNFVTECKLKNFR